MKYCLLLLLLGFASCVRTEPAEPLNVEGYAPVYFNPQQSATVTFSAARPTNAPGKIYAYQNWLFQVDQYQGIHFIDNSNTQSPSKVGFLQVPGATEIAIKGGFLYTNNLGDLVVFSLASMQSPQLVNRLADAFPQFNQSYPPIGSGYFECPDPSKGIVVGWEQKILTNAKCRR